jgi:hypothetical protein
MLYCAQSFQHTLGTISAAALPDGVDLPQRICMSCLTLDMSVITATVHHTVDTAALSHVHSRLQSTRLPTTVANVSRNLPVTRSRLAGAEWPSGHRDQANSCFDDQAWGPLLTDCARVPLLDTLHP